MSRARFRMRMRPRGTLAVIAALLLGSALVRLGDGVGQAMARSEADAARAPDSPAQCETPADLQQLLTEMTARESRLSEDEAALADRREALALVDAQIARKLEELAAAEDSLRRTLAIAETAAEDDIARLTRVYETMKPKQAAALFEQMDASFAAGFLARMRPDAAAEIMAGLSPEAAHMLSVVLAGRNAASE
ncbi:flagellar motility protein MotE (MotC chaperone) [Roseovarius sp. MBR-78]|jgi:flagellar motility protein MotE (MotC chaperone)|uniref:MotE family protein n=1 Tax=Roseovarius sp. MBR-78 TaxID=3156460 RepID=UPI003390E443